MTNFDKMEQNFVALTEEELMNVDGGIAPLVVAFGVAAFKGLSVTGGAIILGAGLYQVGKNLK